MSDSEQRCVTDPTILAYAAGIVDGEGCINSNGIKPESNKLGSIRVAVSNTDRRVIEWLQENFGGSIYDYPQTEKRNYYSWQVFCKKAELFLRAICPYLIIKQEQAEVAIELRNLKRKREECGRGKSLTTEELNERNELVEELSNLKRR